jgi:hypothetical protein
VRLKELRRPIRVSSVMASSAIETPLARAERHVEEGARIIARQRELIDRLAGKHQDTRDAEVLLHQFEETQELHVSDRDRLRKNFGGR